MEESQVQILDKQHGNSFDWLKEFQWQKGQSGNPAGRPKEKTLKEFARSFLANMSEENRIEYLKKVKPEVIWEMAEGKAKQDIDMNANLKITMADVLRNQQRTRSVRNIIEQTIPVGLPIQDTKQEQGVSDVSKEQSTATLPSPQVVEKYNPEEPPTGVYNGGKY